MQVPYLSKWQREIDALRAIALNCDLTEETKWGKPCFTAFGKNVAILIPLKESCALSFFQGALLKDPARILQKIGEHTQAARWIKFTSVREITALKSSLLKTISMKPRHSPNPAKRSSEPALQRSSSPMNCRPCSSPTRS